MELTKEILEAKLTPYYPGVKLIVGVTTPVSGFIVWNGFEDQTDLHRHQDVRQHLKKALGKEADLVGILEPHTEIEITKLENDYLKNA